MVDQSPASSGRSGGRTPRPSLLARTSVHRSLPNALLILMAVFFLVPFALRGARMAIQEMKNDVKDWLPSDFQETTELAWFGRHFVGEQFVLLTWPGCTSDDQKMELLVDKLRLEATGATGPLVNNDAQQVDPAAGDPTGDPDSADLLDATNSHAADAPDSANTDADADPLDAVFARIRTAPQDRWQAALQPELERAREFGDRRALFAGPEFANWGGLNEKWLQSENGGWYYVLPNGDVYQWHGRANAIGWIGRSVGRMLGRYKLDGDHVAQFGADLPLEDGAPNPFYSDPHRLSARLFKTVETGPELLEQLSHEGGPLWPFGDVSEEYKPIKARRDSHERLTGTLFAPALPDKFTWTADDFQTFVGEETLSRLPANWETTFNDFVAEIVERDYGSDRDKLIAATSSARARHWYALFDRFEVAEPPRQTAIVVTLSDIGRRNLDRVLGRGLFGASPGRLLELAAESGITPPPPPPMSPPPFNWAAKARPIPEPALRMGGPPVDNVAIDEEGRITQVRLIGYSVLLGLTLSYLCFRSVKVTTMVFFVGGISAVSAVGFVWWFGSTLDAVLLSMPPLVYVLGLSGAVHIVNYYRDAVEERGLAGAPGHALRHGWWPCTLAAFTTAIGLLSLYTSNIVPIRKFGLFAAIGVMATLGVLFLYLPSALETFVPRFRPRRKTPSGGETAKETETASDASHNIADDFLTRCWAAVGRWIVAHHRGVSLTCLLLLVGFAYGLTKINTSVQLLKLFDSDSKIIKDYEWLEANVGKLVPMELVIRVAPDRMRPPREEMAESGTPRAHEERFQLSFLERAEIARTVQRVVEDEFGEEKRNVVGRAMSAATLMPELPPPAGASAFDRSSLERMKFLADLEESRDELFESDFLRIDQDEAHAGSELWRVSLRVGALNDVDYGMFVHELKNAVEPVMTAYRYRDEILQSIDDARGGAGFWKTDEHGIPRVLVLGSPDPDSIASDEDNAKNDDAKKEADASTPDETAVASTSESLANGSLSTSGEMAGEVNSMHEIDQTRIFTSTLKGLLTNASFRRTVWHDPTVKPLAESFPDMTKWGETLAMFDAVVLVGEHSDYDLDYIRQHAKSFVDARDHRFQNTDGTLTANQRNDGRGERIHTVYTGLVPVVYKAQRTLLISLIESIGYAFVLIAAVMSMLLNPGNTWRESIHPRNIALGIGAGLSSMLPNIFPVAIIFGAMGYLGRLVDIGSMMTASVAMGVAVDDTIHFLTWYRTGVRSGLKRRDAIVQAYKRCAAAMTQTTLIGGLGLSVFAISTFTPTQQFGVLMLALLAAALVGDLLFLPAILAGPLGRLFTPERETTPGKQIVVKESASKAADASPAPKPAAKPATMSSPSPSPAPDAPPSKPTAAPGTTRRTDVPATESPDSTASPPAPHTTRTERDAPLQSSPRRRSPF